MISRSSPDSPPDAYTLRKLRFLAELSDGTRRLLFGLLFTGRDTSFYVIPYGLGSEYHYGIERFGHREKSKTFKYTGQLNSREMPKLSLHRSGWVRAAVGSRETARLMATPFHLLSGQHVATLRVDGLDGLPIDSGPIRSSGSKRDLVTRIAAPVNNLRIVIRANSRVDQFEGADSYSGGSPWVIPVFRQTERMFLGVFIVDNSEMSAGTTGTVSTAIAGWDVRKPRDEELVFVYLVAK